MPKFCIKPYSRSVLMSLICIVASAQFVGYGSTSPVDGDGDGGEGERNNEQKNYVNFESAAVRPIAQSKDGKRILITNTPNQTLDVFEYNQLGKLAFSASKPFKYSAYIRSG